MGRKNGKSSLIAMLVLVFLCGPKARPNGQICSAARSRDQAALVFDLASKMVRMSPDLSALVQVKDSAKALFCPELGSKYRALSADADTNSGLSAFVTIHDELGQVVGPRDKLYDILDTASGAHSDPLSIVISTQAAGSGDLLSMLIDDALSGADDTNRCMLFAAGDDDDPWSEETWRKANPALGDFRSLPELREMAERAKRMPSAEAAFRNLYLNQRVSGTSPFVSRAVWEACAGEVDEDVLRRYDVHCGVDLSKRTDLTAVVLAARDVDGLVHVVARFFAPADGLRERAQRDRVPYDVWANRGWLTVTPGATVQYAFVAREIGRLAREFRLRSVRFDRWRFDDLERELHVQGIPCYREDEDGGSGHGFALLPHGQGFRDMSPALELLEDELANHRLRHGGHPILTWNAASAIATEDAAGNRKLDKAKASGRIDGMVALAMAVHGLGRAPVREPSVYLSRGLVTL